MTVLLLRSTHGKISAIAWVAGMTTVRLLQGLLLGLVFAAGDLKSGPGARLPGTSTQTALLLLVLGALMLTYAARQFLHEQDPDAPPPKWLKMTDTMGPIKAGGFGAALIAVGVKAWVFNFGAVAAIGDGRMGPAESVVTFLLFTALCMSVHFAIIVSSILVPQRADPFLLGVPGWLGRHSRTMVIVVGLVVGTWLVIRGLVELDIF